MKGSTPYALATLFLTLAISAFAQQGGDTVPSKTTKVYLEHADIQSFDKEINADRQVLTGNVRFRHDSSFMYCDSAYFFEKNSSIEAFGMVRMEQGDTLFVFGDYLFYDGIKRLAIMRENVRMESLQADSSIVTLFTDSLNYDRTTDIGYYFDGGMIVDQENELTSIYGQYSPTTKIAIFQDSVQLTNPQFTLSSDTLHYHTETKIATILGPSVIVSDSGTIHSSKGWYNTADNTSLLLDRSKVYSGDRMLTGDSIVYDRATGFGEAFGNIFLHDTLNKIILEGQYGYYNEKTEFAYATDSARCLEYSQGDTLYMHADIFEMAAIDSTKRELKAYHHVRFFRNDIQGICDSMLFDTKDSVLYMYTDPVLWNEQYQLYGDTIKAYMRDSVIDYVLVRQFSFAVQQLDSSAFNQLKGRDLYAYFEGKAVRMIYIDGNAETIYYPIEEDNTMTGLNETRSSYLRIWFNDGKLEKLLIWPEPQAKMTPIPDLKPEQKTLKDFYWYDYLRPRDKDDIYRLTERKTDEKPKRSNKFRNFAPDN
jgi:lipopolysaccharide export system protein LptA